MTQQKARAPLTTTEDVLAAFADLRPRLEHLHMPEFLGVDVTMSQAKVLLLVVAAGELHLSELVRRLGTSLSTVSGHVERLVEQGLVERRDDPADRRQVLVTPTPAAIEQAARFDQVNATHLRTLIDDLDPDERGDVARAFGHLTRAIDRHLTRERASTLPERTHP